MDETEAKEYEAQRIWKAKSCVLTKKTIQNQNQLMTISFCKDIKKEINESTFSKNFGDIMFNLLKRTSASTYTSNIGV